MNKKPLKANLEMLSVIVPVYGCKTITKDLKSIEKEVSGINLPFEIICVVDGKASNKDNTKNRAKKS